MKDLMDFETGLQARIGCPTRARPFVCDGSPLAATIFLVGFNPATELEVDFWNFWTSGRGFDRISWREAYLHERAAKPLRPGKKSKLLISPTRRNIEEFVRGAGREPVLETNIFAIASSSKPELAIKDRDSEPFRFLLDRIEPRVIVTHGKDARIALDKMSLSMPIKSVRHLSRGWSRSAAFELGRSVAESISL